MRKRNHTVSWGVRAALLLLGGLMAGEALGVTRITSIDFKASGGESVVELTGSGPLTVAKQENEGDKQIVLEIQDSELAKGAGRKLDTSSFDGPVSLVSPYQVEGQPNLSRVVIQLREMVPATVSQDGNKVRLVIAGGGGAGAGAATAANDAVPAEDGVPPLDPPASDPAAEAAASPPAPSQGSGGQDQLGALTEARATRRFSGRPISIQVRDADLVDVFRLISEASGFNIVVADDVRGNISLSLTDVPWDQILDVILSTKQLGAERSGNVLRVVTLQGLAAEKSNELYAKRATEASAPRVTRIFGVSYADPLELAVILRSVVSEGVGSVAAGGGFAQQLGGAAPAGPITGGGIQVDTRTNSLIVQDLPETVEKVRKLIDLLDTQTPQVLIEAKVVEASEAFSKTINGSLGLGTQDTNQFFASFAGANPVDPLIGTPGLFASGADIGNITNAAGSATGAIGVSPRLTFLPGVQRLNALLNLGESESLVKVISSPKTVVLNKTQSTIVQGTPVLIPGVTTVPGVGLVPTATVQSADLSLTVTPTVTNDGNLLMSVNLTRAVPFDLGGGNSGIANRAITTTVVVESGSTLVIGGIYTMSQNTASSGFPILRKIPILGWFFGTESDRTERSELFMFITPRILNEKEGGLSG